MTQISDNICCHKDISAYQAKHSTGPLLRRCTFPTSKANQKWYCGPCLLNACLPQRPGPNTTQIKSSVVAEAMPQGPIAALLGWLCSGGTQMAAMASLLLTAILCRVLWVGEAGPAPPWLLLPSFRLCFSQLGYQGRWLPAEPRANGQMGSPPLRTKSKTLLTLPVFLARISQKNFSVASIPAST